MKKTLLEIKERIEQAEKENDQINEGEGYAIKAMANYARMTGYIEEAIKQTLLEYNMGDDTIPNDADRPY